MERRNPLRILFSGGSIEEEELMNPKRRLTRDKKRYIKKKKRRSMFFTREEISTLFRPSAKQGVPPGHSVERISPLQSASGTCFNEEREGNELSPEEGQRSYKPAFSDIKRTSIKRKTVYKSSSNLKKLLRYHQGKDVAVQPEIVDYVRHVLCGTLKIPPEKTDATQVKRVLRMLNRNDCYKCIPAILRELGSREVNMFSNETEQVLEILLNDIAENWRKFRDEKGYKRKNCLSFNVLLREILMLLDLPEEASRVSNLKSKENSAKQNIMCKDLFLSLGHGYIDQNNIPSEAH